jgi:asparagine synthase (glutamine-hydrolysing)
MCGICGIYGIEDRDLVQRMVSVLRHRGPDDSDIYTHANISLGHARLSIIDLSERGRQPMCNEDGSIWLVVNGEIYNFIELRAELEKKGHHFYSNSDSETIIHAYEEYGLNFLDRLRGMFALALYDEKIKRLTLARDPIGKKPLYYHHKDGHLIFASEIKAIFQAGVKKEINESALQAYLAYQYSLGEQTLFAGVKKVPAGHRLVFEAGKLTIQKYWDISENITRASDDYYVKRLRALLEESTRLRMIADVPVGAFLSGGIDSSAIVALATRHARSDFHTFSVGFETFSELEYARLVSRHLGTVHHETTITGAMVREDLPKIAWYYDEPLGDAAIINNYYLSREAKKYVKVVLAGEGGDELFAGYQNYARNLSFYDYFRLPSLARVVVREAIGAIPGKGNPYSPGSLVYRFASFLSQPDFEKAHLYYTREMSDALLRTMSQLDLDNIENLAIEPPQMHQPLNKMLAIDCKNLLPEKFLMKADKGTMANSVEERLPFLDREIIEFAFSVPKRLKIHRGQGKYILRKAVEDLLPPEIVSREKLGFGTTVGHWLANELYETVYQKLSEGSLLRQVIRPEQREALLGNLSKAIKNRASYVWTLFALELWYETHFEATAQTVPIIAITTK